MRFRALTSFKATIGERQSSYVKGLSYSARPQDKALIEAAEEWLKEDPPRIEILDSEPAPRATVGGTAKLGPKPAA